MEKLVLDGKENRRMFLVLLGSGGGVIYRSRYLLGLVCVVRMERRKYFYLIEGCSLWKFLGRY